MYSFLETGGDFRRWPRELAMLWLASDINPEASDDGTRFALIYQFETDASSFVFERAEDRWEYSIYDSQGKDWIPVQSGSCEGKDKTKALRHIAVRWAIGCRIIAKRKIDWDQLLS